MLFEGGGGGDTMTDREIIELGKKFRQDHPTADLEIIAESRLKEIREKSFWENKAFVDRYLLAMLAIILIYLAVVSIVNAELRPWSTHLFTILVTAIGSYLLGKSQGI